MGVAYFEMKLDFDDIFAMVLLESAGLTLRLKITSKQA